MTENLYSTVTAPEVATAPLPNHPLDKPIRVGLLGYGTVGRAFTELLLERRAAIEQVTGITLEITRVAIRDRAKTRTSDLDARVFTDDAMAVVTSSHVDIVVELIGGGGRIKDLVLAALSAGKPVVTANKELVGTAGLELFNTADAARTDLLFEAAAVAAVPLLRPIRESLLGEKVTRIAGIVNGTTNFILTRMMLETRSFEDVLDEAQRLGLAESDPTADVEGTDAAAKIAILASLAFNRAVVTADVTREGIADLEPDDFSTAAQFGYVLKLLGTAEQLDDGSVGAQVFPALVALDHPLANVRDSYNAVLLSTGAAGDLMFYGHGAGPRPSASSVLGDVVEAAGHLGDRTHRRVPVGGPATICPSGQLRHPYLVRLDVEDLPGVLSEVTGVLARGGISINNLTQRVSDGRARLVLTTFSAPEQALACALAELHTLPHVRDVGRTLRIHE